jgi:hypothetical protein
LLGATFAARDWLWSNIRNRPAECMKVLREERSSLLVMATLVAVTAPRPAYAIRPFVTDDARVVGHKLAQLATWILLDHRELEHDLLAAIGPTDWLELTLGLRHGGVHSGLERG